MMRALFRFPRAVAATLLLLPTAALAQGAPAAAPVNWHAVVMFMVFIALTLGITYLAAKRTKTATDFYAAGRGITALQNGLAIAGDYMSAASLLGISALVFTSGYDGLIYSIGFLASWPIILFLIAEPLRNLGRYTLADVVSYRLQQRPIRAFASTRIGYAIAPSCRRCWKRRRRVSLPRNSCRSSPRRKCRRGRSIRSTVRSPTRRAATGSRRAT